MTPEDALAASWDVFGLPGELPVLSSNEEGSAPGPFPLDLQKATRQILGVPALGPDLPALASLLLSGQQHNDRVLDQPVPECELDAPGFRPAGAPKWGLTAGQRVVEICRWAPHQQRQDPIVKVTAAAWPEWYPVEAGDVPSCNVTVRPVLDQATEVDGRFGFCHGDS
jgi:hypothetical protein